MTEQQLAIQAENGNQGMSLGNKLRFYGSLFVVTGTTALTALGVIGCGGEQGGGNGEPVGHGGNVPEATGGSQAGSEDQAAQREGGWDGTPIEEDSHSPAESQANVTDTNTVEEEPEGSSETQDLEGTAYASEDSIVADTSNPDVVTGEYDLPPSSVILTGVSTAPRTGEEYLMSDPRNEYLKLGDNVDLEGLQQKCQELAVERYEQGIGVYEGSPKSALLPFLLEDGDFAMYSCLELPDENWK